MSSVLSSVGSARRSIRNIWLKDLYYFRSNHPFFILIFIALFVTCYNVWWHNAQAANESLGATSRMDVFDNFRLSKHKFVRMMICIPKTVVDYRFSTVTDAIRLTHLDFPALEFTKDLEKARKRLSDGDIDILILFTKLIETGKDVEYNIISQNGDLNKHYCIHCDDRRKETWGNAIESQIIVNRFLYWMVRSRGLNHRKPHFHLSNIYVKGTDSDPMYSKRQTDLFIAWLILIPICSRLIDLWNDERESGFYKLILSLRVRRIEYFIAKFVFWYGISLVISLIFFVVNVSVVPAVFTATYLPFLVCYVACIIMFTVFLATLFPGSPLVSKFVGFLLMAAGEFGFGNVYQGTLFFQLSVRFFGKTEGDGYWIDAVCLMCMTVNSILMMALSVYLDTFFFSYTQGPLKFYFPLERSYWMPAPRGPLVDKFFIKQILVPKVVKNESALKKSVEAASPIKKTTTNGKEANPKEISHFPLVVLYGICKQINNHWKVNQLSLTIRLGEVLTLYGHYGCGSDEILSILSGQMKPEYGEVMMEKSQRHLIVSMTEDVPNLNYLTVTNYLEFVCSMRGVSLSSSILTEMLEELDLVKVQNRPLDLLSTTQKERLRIAAVFVGHPDLVLIDWPTKESLPEWKYMILRFVEKRKENKAIIISSYDAEETEAISDKVVLLSEGYVVLNGSSEIYKQSMNSVFEVRLWPLFAFTDDQIRGMIAAVTLGDEQMKNDAKFFETPNGKIRITLPIIYRRSIPLIIRELEAIAAQYEIAFYEFSKPNIHDIYTNSCYEPLQYQPLENYDQLKEYYAKQEPISRTMYFFKNMVRILKDRQFLYQAAAIFGLFLVLGLLTLISYHGTHQHYTHEISFEANDHPITIYCDDCNSKGITSSQVTFVKKNDRQQLMDNQAVIYWKPKSAKADLELFSVSRGDETFTMVIQNFAISQLIGKMIGKPPRIKPILESGEFRTSITETGFSMVFNDVSKNQAAMILSESYPLMYTLGVFQTFVYTLSAILPLRLISVNMRPDSLLFPWPRYLYFGLIFGANLIMFMVLSIVLISIFLFMGFFQTSAAFCFFRLFGAWFLSYISTLPLIYLLVFTIQNSMAVIPTVMAISSLLTAIWSTFERGTTLKPGARIKNSFLFPASSAPQTGDSTTGEKPSIADGTSRSAAGAEIDAKPSLDYISGASSSNEDMSYITNYEEHLIGKMATMKKWNDNQEIPVDNSATYLLGDQTKLKSSLLKTIAETNPKEQIAYVPFVECLPSIYTPFELLVNVAACHGFEVTEEHINYLLNAFGMKSLAATPISLLTDADRRILMLLTKLVIKPSIVIIDQLEMFLPHPKMMTVWAICARLRADGVAIMYTSRHNSFAEHTATCCAHVYKCQFVSTLPPSTIKARMGYTVLEIVPKDIEPLKLLKMIQMAMPDAIQMPSTRQTLTVILKRDDVDTVEMVLGNIRTMSSNIQRYSLRSGNFDEFVASAFGK
ncbi:hypothetical protein B9Z55_014305 [Caenorhabditis nigoni]|uniref:ABC transporter domain-containing protein n=1 Tax=Caenorhabditis nigoni TaxID=1611254 RepID=A0A2G5U5C9_9PELO|nr:hypothetical protein B9Z55_014305 [Caenorhabditis nigoni]